MMEGMKQYGGAETEGKTGIGGWLLFFVLRGIIAVIVHVLAIPDNLDDLGLLLTIPGTVPALLLVAAILRWGMVLFMLASLIEVFRRKRFAIILYCVSAGISIVVQVLMLIADGLMGFDGRAYRLFVYIVLDALMIMYLFRSKRVKNTLVR